MKKQSIFKLLQILKYLSTFHRRTENQSIFSATLAISRMIISNKLIHVPTSSSEKFPWTFHTESLRALCFVAFSEPTNTHWAFSFRNEKNTCVLTERTHKYVTYENVDVSKTHRLACNEPESHSVVEMCFIISSAVQWNTCKNIKDFADVSDGVCFGFY